ncbi:MAG: winged helix-turn-helix transcriptional regulator [Candidatus Helarchaeota archaeon]
MDKIDIKIFLLLMINSRLTYREIADHLRLSVNAVYKRVQTLINLGIIKKFTASIKPSAINAIYSFIFGKSEAQDVNQIISEIGKHENTFNIMLSSRNYIYIGGLLKNIHELDEYMAYISQVAKIKSPRIGFLHKVYSASLIPYNIPKFQAINIDKLDKAIIRSLHNDSRKPISEIAEDIKSTSNTVRRRLSRMIENGLIDLSIQFNPVSSNDIFTLLQITLDPFANKEETGKRLIDMFKPNIFFCWTFSNLPNFLLCYTWCNTMNELNDLIIKIKKENVESIISDVLFKGLYYDTWKEKILYE